MAEPPPDTLLGHIAPDPAGATNERVLMRAEPALSRRVLRNQFVRVIDALSPEVVFLGRILEGPFYPAAAPDDRGLFAGVEIQGELTAGQPHETSSRPAPGSAVHELTPAEVGELLGFAGDMLLGSLSGRDDLSVCLSSGSKDILPRNVGIFGTVGSGKSNSVQVLLEEASARGWAAVLLDLEGEYVEMDAPMDEARLAPRLAHFGRRAEGLRDFRVSFPASCASDRAGSEPFTLRLADFETTVIAEILQTTLAERNALLECVDYFEQKSRTKLATSELETLLGLLDASPNARLPFTLPQLRTRAGERSPRGSEFLDYQGLATKLQWLMHSGAFDQPGMKGLDVGDMLRPGRVNVIDVSVANDTVKNLVTADLVRKTFAYKIAHPEAPPTLLVIEEAHSFISRERAQMMQSTLQMLRNVTRRGRKRWLSMAFVSQQPGHLPPEIFELCNTRIVHTLRSLHNLDALMATTSDVTRELWARCPLLGTGEAIVSSPQLKRSVVVRFRPASSRRRFVR